MTHLATRRSALLLVGLGAAALPLAARIRPAFAQSSPDEYVKLTLEAGLFAMKTSQLALEKAKSDAVKTFAELEIGEQEAVKEVLTSTGVAPPADVDGEEKTMMETLMGLEGAEFDTAYLDAQVKGHEELLAIQQPMAGMGEITIPVANAKLATAAIKSHLVMLKGIQAMM